jgi:thioredoxin-dependent peroxiredoxin
MVSIPSAHRTRTEEHPVAKLSAGDKAPDFTLDDADGKPVSLSDFTGRKLVVFFYPAAMTAGCTKEACDFRDSQVRLQRNGYEVIGISPDSPDKQRQFIDKEHLTYSLLSDPDKETLEAYGAWGEKQLYGKTVTGVIRSTVVVDEEGTVELAKYNVKATGHVAALATALGLPD